MGNFNQGFVFVFCCFSFSWQNVTVIHKCYLTLCFLQKHWSSFFPYPPGEKPFSCPHCNRAFADRSNLRAHLQTHSDVKKYQCKNCSKTFSRMSLLHKHEESGCCVAHWVTQPMFTRTECISSLQLQMTNKSPKAFSLVLTDQIICTHTHTHTDMVPDICLWHQFL